MVMPGSISEYFGVLSIPVECQRKALLKANLRLPARQAAQLCGIDVLTVDLAVGDACTADVGSLIEGGYLAERLDHIECSARNAAAGIERLAPSSADVQ